MKQILKKIIVKILTLEAKLVLKRYKPKIIAVTGNVGKTSTKDAVYTVLSRSVSIRKNQKSFNSEIGVPLTILGLENAWGNPLKWTENIIKGAYVYIWKQKYPEWLVLEIGADHPHDIEDITKWLIPNIVVMTRIPEVPVHVEYFKDADALMEEKAFLLKALPDHGIAILNADDKNILALEKYVKGTVIHYGIENNARIQADKYGLMYDGDNLAGMQFRILYESNAIPVILKGIVGIHHVYPILASICAGIAIGMPFAKLSESFSLHDYPNGRMNILKGINDTVIIDDTYNSSPIALELALKTLKEVLTKGRKIAVLGDMLELGSYSSTAHKECGIIAGEVADVLLTVGVRARDFKESALKVGMKETSAWSFSTSSEAGEFLKNFIKEGDVVLIKGSQSMRMEKAVAMILEDKENVGTLLVRQEKDWSKR